MRHVVLFWPSTLFSLFVVCTSCFVLFWFGLVLVLVFSPYQQHEGEGVRHQALYFCPIFSVQLTTSGIGSTPM